MRLREGGVGYIERHDARSVECGKGCDGKGCDGKDQVIIGCNKERSTNTYLMP